MMRAIQINKFGPPNVLQLLHIEVPKVSSSQVLVKIIAAGVNPVDTYVREGAFLKLPDLPYTPGKDAAGVVEAVGENISKFKVGERVFICGRNLGKYGTYAEYALVQESDVFLLDNRLSFEQGAALGIPYFTAYRALVLKGKCLPGETVLIHGASGGVGLACVQLGKNMGLKVIGTAGTTEGLKIVQDTGADYVLCHKEKKYMEKILEISENKGVNIIIEMLANVNLNNDLDVLAPNGRIAIVGSRGAIRIDPRKMMGPETIIFGVALLNSTEDEWVVTSNGILEGIKKGWISPVIGKKYSLEKAKEAHEDIIHSSGAKGKLVLSVQELQ